MQITPKLRKLKRPPIFACLALALTGCAVDELEASAQLEDEVDPSAALELDAESAGAVPTSMGLGEQIVGCPGARIVGVLNDKHLSCNIPGMPSGWTGIRVFESGTPSLAALGLPAPGELRRYCMFESQFPLNTPADYDQMLGVIASSSVMPLDTVAADCRGQATQASLNDAELGAAMRDVFRDNIDWVDAAALAGGLAHAIQVSLIDTVSDSGPPINQHGLQLAAIIEDIVCPPGSSCLARIEHQLALPREDWASPPNWINGGNHGTQVDVALAIYEEVVLWHQARTSPGMPERLVVNLSLGYDRGPTVDLLGDRGPELALKSALEHAACSGALVFAASGNDRDPSCDAGSDDDGPLLPAAYQDHPALTQLECFAAGYPHSQHPNRPVFSSSTRPLVYAVGGVDAGDERLINSRVGGQPRLVATGNNGLAEADAGSFHTPLTGTSVATAVTSAAAALLWTFNPKLRPDQVAEILYSSGWATGATAEFGSPESTPVSRLSVCAALEQACDGATWACPQPGCVAGPPAGASNLGPYVGEVNNVLALASVYASADQPIGVSPNCLPTDWSNLAEPQPEVPVCPHCNIDVPPEEASSEPDDLLTMQVDPRWLGAVQGGYLTVYDSARSPTRFMLDAATIMNLNAGNVVTVVVDAPGTVSAALTFTISSSGRTSSNPITVTR